MGIVSLLPGNLNFAKINNQFGSKIDVKIENEETLVPDEKPVLKRG